MPRRWLQKFEKKPGCWVFVPDSDTIQRGQEIKRKIESHWKPPPYYAHLNAGGHVEALRKHIASRLFIKADIHQFFNQINRTRVTRNLRDILGSYKLARSFADDSLVRLPNVKETITILPYGFVQSPIIASLCLYRSALGRYLDHLSKDGFTVSVYMDDIVISTIGDMHVAEEIRARLDEVAGRSRLSFSKRKTVGPAEEITAFNVKLRHGSMEIVDERLSEFQAEISKSDNPNQINGVIGYVRTVCPEQADFLLSVLS